MTYYCTFDPILGHFPLFSLTAKICNCVFLFCTVTNKCTIDSQIITLLHVSTLILVNNQLDSLFSMYLFIYLL